MLLFFLMRFELGTLDSGERSLSFGLLVYTLNFVTLYSYSLGLVLPDIDWSVHNSPDLSESKNTEKGLTFTGALIFCCTLLVRTMQ